MKKCFLWTTSVAQLLDSNCTKVGGINIQMYLWSRIFIDSGWKVFSFREPDSNLPEDGICFLKRIKWPFVLFPFYWIVVLFTFIKVSPDLIITRGGTNRNLFFVSMLARIFRVKMVHFVASDMELTNSFGSFPEKMNMFFFKLGIRLVEYIVVQNDCQRVQAISIYRKKKVLLIPNIWNALNDCEKRIKTDILWVANIKTLKRPLLFVELAKKFPELHFVMIGGAHDKSLYDKCLAEALLLDNLEFTGYLDFFRIEACFAKAKILVCTSEYEGFPNTFLQAWCNEVPVLSTVNPSHVITDEGLGVYISDTNNLCDSLKALLEEDLYFSTRQRIREYFNEAHSAVTHYNRLMKFLTS